MNSFDFSTGKESSLGLISASLVNEGSGTSSNKLSWYLKTRAKGIRRLALIFSFSILFILCASWLSGNNGPKSSWWKFQDQLTGIESKGTPHQVNLNPHQKFLVRDWSIWLGWNNVRYTLETALLMAKILDRTLVLPAFTYARSCEEENHVCAALTPGFVKGVPVDLNEISNRTWYPDADHGKHVLSLKVEGERGWVMPLENLLDIDHLIATWGNAIRLQDFLKLTNPDPSFHSIGLSSGKWNTDFNLNMTYRTKPPSVYFGTNLVDRLPLPVTPLINSQSPSNKSASLIRKCESILQKLGGGYRRKRGAIPPKPSTSDQDVFLAKLDETLIHGRRLDGAISESDNPLLESCLASQNLRSVYTFNMMAWWMKSPYKPIKIVKPIDSMTGFWDELHKLDEKILHIEGEIHGGLPPASMMWSSLAGRQEYERLTRAAMKPPEWYHRVAARIELKIRARCEGRSWISAHMRRGDFVSFGWSPNNLTTHWEWVENSARHGVNLLQSNPDLLKPSHLQLGTSLKPPRLGDPIYISTNARNPEEVAYLRANNAILLSDLLDQSDKSELGFAGKFMDSLAVLEQCIMMRAGYFQGDAHSSVDGWVLNRRVFYGIDAKLTNIGFSQTINGDETEYFG